MSSNTYPEPRQENEVTSKTVLNNNVLNESATIPGLTQGSVPAADIDNDVNGETNAVHTITKSDLVNCEVSLKKSVGEDLLKLINKNHNEAKAEYKKAKEVIMEKHGKKLEELKKELKDKNTEKYNAYKTEKEKVKTEITTMFGSSGTDYSKMSETEADIPGMIDKLKELKELKLKFKQSIKDSDDGSSKVADEETKIIEEEVNKVRVTYKEKRNAPLTDLHYECRIYLTNKANDLGKYFGAQKYYYTGKIVEIHPNNSEGIKVELGREIFSIAFSNVCINSGGSTTSSESSASSSKKRESESPSTKQKGGAVVQDGGYYNPYNPYKQYHKNVPTTASELSAFSDNGYNENTSVEMSQTSAFDQNSPVELSQTSAFDQNSSFELSQTSALDQNDVQIELSQTSAFNDFQ